ncbi:MAG: hypothetical protein GC154_18165 [bacterium]|nr:hypothetical protein [bacterium]
MWKPVFTLGIAVLFSVAAAAQEPVGEYTNHIDIGEPNIPGTASFADGKYTIEGGGATIGRQSFVDQFHFVYKELSGSFSIVTDPVFIELNGEGGPMIRQDLDPDSAHVSWLRTGPTLPSGGNTNAADGSVFPHFRSLKGGGTIVDGDPEPGGFTDNNVGPIRLDRIGNSFYFYTMNTAGGWVLVQDEIVPMAEKVFAGIALTANNADGLALVEFESNEINLLPLWVGRSIPVDGWQSGATFTVTVTAKARSSVNASVTEKAPRLATISNVKVSTGTVSSNPSKGTINWSLPNFSSEATLTYDITLPNRKSGSWQGVFNDGVNPQSWIGGDAVLPKKPVFKTDPAPVQISSNKPTIIQIEDMMHRPDNPNNRPGLALMLNPEVESGIVAVNVTGSVGDWIQIPVVIPAGYGETYMFGRVRGEDGNSDSFFIDLGYEPISDNLTIWDSGGGKSFHYDWVLNRIPEDPRPFSPDAGEQLLYISPREDSASIDWIAITNDPSFRTAALDELTGEIIDPFAGIVDNLGIFDARGDVAEAGNANLGAAGKSGYDPSTGVYKLVGSGNDIWNAADNFHFMYKEVSGDVSIEATVYLDPFSGDGTWSKAGVMVRNDLTPGSTNALGLIRTQGRDFGRQWRPVADGSSSSVSTLVSGSLASRIGLQRVGNKVTYYYYDNFTGQRVDDYVQDGIEFTDPVYVGLAVTAHQVNQLAIGEFSDVKITVNGAPVGVGDWQLY